MSNTSEKIKVMQAFVEGKTILSRALMGGQWGRPLGAPTWNWYAFDYKVQELPREGYFNAYEDLFKDSPVGLYGPYQDQTSAKEGQKLGSGKVYRYKVTEVFTDEQ